jgi:hypothetical protein
VAVLSIAVEGDAAGTSVQVGARSVPRERWKFVAVAPGAVEVSARSASGRRALQSVEARLGEITKVTLGIAGLDATSAAAKSEQPALTPTGAEQDAGTERGHALRPWAFVAGGVGVVGLATFGVFGSMSRSTFSELEDACPNGVCPPERQDDIDKGKTSS